MSSITRTNNILENFKLDGITSSNPVEEYREKKKTNQKTKAIYKKCLCMALITNLFQYLLLSPIGPQETERKSEQFKLPMNYSTLRIPIQLTTPIGLELNKVKLTTKNKRSVLSEGIILKSENPEIQKKNIGDDEQQILTVHIPTEKLHEILKHIKTGISVVPFKLKINPPITPRANYEIII